MSQVPISILPSLLPLLLLERLQSERVFQLILVLLKLTITALGYLGAQLLASILATSWLMVVFPKPKEAKYSSIPAAVVVDLTPGTNLVNAFFMEVSLTFILVYVIFATAFDTVDTSKEVKLVTDDKGVTTTQKSKGSYLTIYVRNFLISTSNKLMS